MSDDLTGGGDQRVTISLSTLRAELGALELRLVDRLNGALANKADRAILDQVMARQADGLARLVVLEQRAIRADSPIVQKISDIDQEMVSLREIGRYKKWLWAQTAALVGIAVPVIALFVDHRWITG